MDNEFLKILRDQWAMHVRHNRIVLERYAAFIHAEREIADLEITRKAMAKFGSEIVISAEAVKKSFEMFKNESGGKNPDPVKFDEGGQ